MTIEIERNFGDRCKGRFIRKSDDLVKNYEKKILSEELGIKWID